MTIGPLSSGAFIHYFGWSWVNVGAAPLLIIAVGVTIWYAAQQRRPADA